MEAEGAATKRKSPEDRRTKPKKRYSLGSSTRRKNLSLIFLAVNSS
jgi:hypothetical protein